MEPNDIHVADEATPDPTISITLPDAMASTPAGPRRDRRTVLLGALLSATLASGLTAGLVGLTPRWAGSTDATQAASAAATSAAAGTAASATGTAASAAPAEAAASVTATEVVAQVAAAATPSVVTITTEGTTGFSPFSVPSSGVGSGIVVSADGLILTNNHVIEGGGPLTVTLSDGQEVAATVVATDTTHDLAVIRADATGLTPATLGNATTLQVGQLAIAIGSPLGTFTDTVTLGIVSGLERSIDVSDTGSRTVQHLSGLIQTDAAINSGNSGGPLLDASGTVIGIVTAQAGNAEGVGFAIPIDAARSLIAEATAA